MAFQKAKCPQCGKDANAEATYNIGSKVMLRLKCQHLVMQSQMAGADPSSITSIDGKKLRKFQVEGFKLIEESGGRVLLLDEMGLGKTVQALAIMSAHPEAAPFVVIVKSGLKHQWTHEVVRWCGEDFIPQVIDGSREQMLPGFKCYILSYDVLRRYPKGSLAEQFGKCRIKTLILDECQQIKNIESDRTQACIDLSFAVENFIALSGTPIKNNAAEYFPVLHMCQPMMFPTYAKFLFNDCESQRTQYATKVGGLRYPQEFKEKTKKFIIRRTRKEVMPDLPLIDRNFQFVELGKEVEAAYKQAFIEFQDEYNSMGDTMGFQESSNILAYLSRMRHLTGLSKIRPCSEFVEDFLVNTDRRMCIFVHHKDVGILLMNRLTKVIKEFGLGAPPVQLTSELDSAQRAWVVDQFLDDDPRTPRVMVASTLASGEGLNLQKCSDCIMLERQWNPSNEEQAEGRFPRIGSLASSISATYFIATGTVDEFFTTLVEKKREIVSKTMDGEAAPWDQTSLMRELFDIMATKGGAKWGR